MKGREKQISFILIACLLFAGILWGHVKADGYFLPELPKSSKEQTTSLEDKKITTDTIPLSNLNDNVPGRTNYKDMVMEIEDEFTTSLPLIVIDTGSEQPQRGVTWDDEKGYYVSTGEDPYAYGNIRIIANEDKNNTLNEEGAEEYLCKVKLRGNSSGNYDKKQYQIKLLNEQRESIKGNLLGMGKDSEWILNVSFVDKSLLRNFLAYTTAKEIMPYTPDVRFCEVVWKRGEQYFYEGVYLLMESIKAGENRVDLPRGYENAENVPALIRRDRYNENGTMLNNYASVQGLASGYLEVKYPDKDVITQKQISNIESRINAFEEKLYADTWEEFVQYRDYVDIDSFVDYFIINEFFLNYDAGYNSTYFYMGYDGKITMGPVWDFDQAMDNAYDYVANLYTTAFHAAPWFDKILQDPIFTKKVMERYSELRKTILSDDAMKAYVEETMEYLGTAIERDWARWGYYYRDGNYLKSDAISENHKNTKTYEEETERMLHILAEHGQWLDDNMDSLYQFKSISLEAAEEQNREQMLEKWQDYREALAVVFVIVLLTSVKLVMQYESE